MRLLFFFDDWLLCHVGLTFSKNLERIPPRYQNYFAMHLSCFIQSLGLHWETGRIVWFPYAQQTTPDVLLKMISSAKCPRYYLWHCHRDRKAEGTQSTCDTYWSQVPKLYQVSGNIGPRWFDSSSIRSYRKKAAWHDALSRIKYRWRLADVDGNIRYPILLVRWSCVLSSPIPPNWIPWITSDTTASAVQCCDIKGYDCTRVGISWRANVLYSRRRTKKAENTNNASRSIVGN
jgi:hypothetical protein